VRIDNLRSDDSGGPNLLAKKYALSSLSFNIASSGVGTFGGGGFVRSNPINALAGRGTEPVENGWSSPEMDLWDAGLAVVEQWG
jgi:hypothetical protein